jgi:Tfp pilus assembly protein PilF
VRRNLQRYFWLGLAVAAIGCRGTQGDRAVGPNGFHQASAPQRSWNPFTKEDVPDAHRKAESRPDWRTLQAMMPEDTISLAKPLSPGTDLYVKAARLYEIKNQFPKAIEQYQKALEMDSGDVNALVGLARLYDRLDRPVEAAQVYEQAAGLHPNNGTVFNDMGLCYSKQGRWNEAMVNLDRAVQLQPKNPRYRNNIAKVLIRNGRPDDAFRHLTAVFAPAESHYNVGYIANDIGDDATAQRHLTLAIQNSPDLLSAKELLAEITSPQLGKPEEATAQRRANHPEPNLAADSTRPLHMPQLDAGRFEGPQLEAPQLEAPQLEGPQLEGPQLEAPQLEAPQLDQTQLDGRRLDGPQFRPTSGSVYRGR